jgi:hypothetical protein
MRAFSASLLICLIGLVEPSAIAAGTPAPDTDGTTLSIDAGRLVAMVDQSAEALKVLPPADRNEDGSPEPAQSAHAFDDLVSAVLRYDVIAGEACRARVVDPKLCVGPYLPSWLKDVPEADHSNAALRAMIDDTNAHLEPFWSDICAKARQVAKNETFCQIE